MVLKRFYQKYENQIIAAGVILILGIILALRYDYYYDLNDDVVMKDILSGVCTGEPESRNIQMLYPISLIISLLYRLAPQMPVYGAFLWLCQFGCFWLMAERSMKFRTSTASKLLMAGLEIMVAVTLYLEHFVFVQYTVTCTLLAAAAAFLFITSDHASSVKEFIRINMISILLVLTAFLMRSEMLLLVLPLICVAGIYRWGKEKAMLTRGNIVKYLSVIGCILAGILFGYIVNQAAYGSKEWKIFDEYFDSRTELYDFQGVPSYEGNEELYERLGLTESEQNMLFEQYNFGMDDAVDAGMLDAMSEYQAQGKNDQHIFGENFVRKFKEYFYRTFHKEPAGSELPDDYPFNIMIVFGYMTVFIASIWNEENKKEKLAAALWRGGWPLVLMGGVRTALWMFILMRGRDPVRITHSLYLMELCILLAMLHVECVGINIRAYGKIKATVVFSVIIAITAAASIPASVEAVNKEYLKRAEANVTDKEVKEYCRSHGENFYFLDVYSSVSDPYTQTPYSEKMFRNVDNSLANYDIMGGWVVKSPLYQKKLKAFGIDSMQEALYKDENIYMMAELAKGTEFLSGYYKDQGIPVQIELIDTINEIIGVYKIREVKELAPQAE